MSSGREAHRKENPQGYYAAGFRPRQLPTDHGIDGSLTEQDFVRSEIGEGKVSEKRVRAVQLQALDFHVTAEKAIQPRTWLEA